MTDKALVRAAASGAFISMGRSGWRHYAALGDFEAEVKHNSKSYSTEQVGLELLTKHCNQV
jgi:hypothetical protein